MERCGHSFDQLVCIKLTPGHEFCFIVTEMDADAEKLAVLYTFDSDHNVVPPKQNLPRLSPEIKSYAQQLGLVSFIYSSSG